MDPYVDMVSPPVVLFEGYYKEEDVPDDYFGQRIRGSEIVPCDVQYYGTFNGQY